MKGTSLSPGNLHERTSKTPVISDGYIFSPSGRMPPRTFNSASKILCCGDLSRAGAATKSAAGATTNVANAVQFGAPREIPLGMRPCVIVARRLLLPTLTIF